MNDDAIIRSMRSTSDEELRGITSGAAMGYTDQARAIAEAVLRERRVRLPADLKELRKRAAIAEGEANRIIGDLDAAHDRALGRKLGIKLSSLVSFLSCFPYSTSWGRSAWRYVLLPQLSRSLDVSSPWEQAGTHPRHRRMANAETQG